MEFSENLQPGRSRMQKTTFVNLYICCGKGLSFLYPHLICGKQPPGTMRVAFPATQKHLCSWAVLSKCFKTFHMLFHLLLVLVGKCCCTSWRSGSFSWAVFVWPLRGSPPVARTEEVSSWRRTNNYKQIWLESLYLGFSLSLIWPLEIHGTERCQGWFIGCWRLCWCHTRPRLTLCRFCAAALPPRPPLNRLLVHVVMMPTAAFSHSPDGSQWTAALLLYRKAV